MQDPDLEVLRRQRDELLKMRQEKEQQLAELSDVAALTRQREVFKALPSSHLLAFVNDEGRKRTTISCGQVTKFSQSH